jgi:hypothetical protein
VPHSKCSKWHNQLLRLTLRLILYTTFTTCQLSSLAPHTPHARTQDTTRTHPTHAPSRQPDPTLLQHAWAAAHAHQLGLLAQSPPQSQ